MIKRWKNGPEFLLQPEDNWPVQKDIHDLPSRVIIEEAKKLSLDDEELAIISESDTKNLVVSDDSIQYVKEEMHNIMNSYYKYTSIPKLFF